MKRPTLLIPLLLVALLTSCKQESAPGGNSAAGMRDLVSQGSGFIFLTHVVEYQELKADGVTLQLKSSEVLAFEKGINKPSIHPFGMAKTIGGAAISVSDDGWITLRLQKDVRMIPPTAIKLIEGRMP